MQCMNCSTVIPSEWQACIVSNICPKCGNNIMDDNTKQLSDNLGAIIKLLEEAPDGIMELLLTNYGLKKIDKNDQDKNVVQNEENLSNSLKIPKNSVHDWLKRSGAPHLANRNVKMKDILEKINSAGSDDVYDDNIDYDDDDEEILSVQEEMLDQYPKNITEQVFEPDEELVNKLDKNLHPALQQDRLKRLMQSRGVSQGGGLGPFRRSG